MTLRSPDQVVQVRRAAEGRKRLAVAAAVMLAVAACAAVAVSYSAQGAAEPSIESMYHMWLGPNGLPLSPRKQRALLFQFCTTNFVSCALRLPLACCCSLRALPAGLPACDNHARLTRPGAQVTEAEMRYCYARLLSVGNPSGPVKFSGQPQYDSEQVVSPLFTFSAPPMGGGEEGDEEEAAEEAQVAGTNKLAMTKSAPTAALYQTQQKGAGKWPCEEGMGRWGKAGERQESSGRAWAVLLPVRRLMCGALDRKGRGGVWGVSCTTGRCRCV